MAYDALERVPPSPIEAAPDGSDSVYGLQRIPPQDSISGAWRAMLKRQGRHIARTFKDSAYDSEPATFEQSRTYCDGVMQALPPMTAKEGRAWRLMRR